jgi:hypothetical protein
MLTLSKHETEINSKITTNKIINKLFNLAILHNHELTHTHKKGKTLQAKNLFFLATTFLKLTTQFVNIFLQKQKQKNEISTFLRLYLIKELPEGIVRFFVERKQNF